MTKIEKLREVHKLINEKLIYYETYIFINEVDNDNVNSMVNDMLNDNSVELNERK